MVSACGGLRFLKSWKEWASRGLNALSGFGMSLSGKSRQNRSRVPEPSSPPPPDQASPSLSTSQVRASVSHGDSHLGGLLEAGLAWADGTGYDPLRDTNHYLGREPRQLH